MYLHVGGEVEIFIKRIICIMNRNSINNIESFANQNDCRLIDLSGGKVDSAVLAHAEDSKGFILYLSAISAATLTKRLLAFP